jgi:ketosteroid isomerase-like protein
MKRILFVLWVLSLATAALSQQTCDKRPADRDAIRSHIESIFRAFIDHDGPKLRATHAPEWRGFLQWSYTAIRGVGDYMKNVDGATHPGPNGMKAFKITEFDCVFYGDNAIVPFVSDIESEYGGQRTQSTLRIVDFYAKLNGHWIQAGSDTQAHPKTLEARGAELQTLPDQMKQQLLTDREHVWKAYFANERTYLEQALPSELIAIDPGPGEWSNRDTVLRGSERFAQSGSKLTKIEFPKTEIQAYGNVAQVYSTYVLDFEGPNGKNQASGRATETFVFRDSKWLNVGWHLDAVKPPATTAEK